MTEKSVSQTKRCSKCGEVKGLDEFWRNKGRPDGRQEWCIACMRVIKGHSHKKHKPRIDQSQFPDGYKKCSSCGEVKSIPEFHRHKKSACGVESSCIMCKRTKRGSKARYNARVSQNGVPDGYKRCSQCKEILPLTDFWVQKSRPDGRISYCKRCGGHQGAKKSNTQVGVTNGCRRCPRCEEVKPLNTEYFHTVQTRKNGFSVYCKVCGNESSRRFAKENPHLFREYAANRHHAVRTNSYCKLPLLQDLLDRQNGQCNMCGKFKHEITPYLLKGREIFWHRDHIHPVKHGGTNAENNIQALCWECNMKKGAKVDWGFV